MAGYLTSKSVHLLKETAPNDCQHEPISFAKSHKSENPFYQGRSFAETFDLSPAQFFHEYFSDEVDYYTYYHSQLDAYSDLEIGKWTLCPELCCLTREITFTIGVDVPCGPNSSKVLQSQRCTLSPEGHTFFTTRTAVTDVMYGDCFTADSVWKVSPSGSGGFLDASKCNLEITVFITWLTQPFLKSMVEKLALTGAYDYHAMWLSSAKEYKVGTALKEKLGERLVNKQHATSLTHIPVPRVSDMSATSTLSSPSLHSVSDAGAGVEASEEGVEVESSLDSPPSVSSAALSISASSSSTSSSTSSPLTTSKLTSSGNAVVKKKKSRPSKPLPPLPEGNSKSCSPKIEAGTLEHSFREYTVIQHTYQLIEQEKNKGEELYERLQFLHWYLAHTNITTPDDIAAEWIAWRKREGISHLLNKLVETTHHLNERRQTLMSSIELALTQIEEH